MDWPVTSEPSRAKARPLRPRRSCFGPAEAHVSHELGWSRRVLPPGPKGLLQRPFIAISGLRRHLQYRPGRLTKKEPLCPAGEKAACPAKLVNAGPLELSSWTMRPGHLRRDLAYLELHDTDRAILDFDQAVMLEPSNAAALNHRAEAYRAAGDRKRAAADYDAAIRLHPRTCDRHAARVSPSRVAGLRPRA